MDDVLNDYFYLTNNDMKEKEDSDGSSVESDHEKLIGTASELGKKLSTQSGGLIKP